jgi:hypothetical protein
VPRPSVVGSATRPADPAAEDPAAGGQADDDANAVGVNGGDVAELEAARGGGRNDARAWGVDGHTLARVCAIYRVLPPPKVLSEGVTARSSAAIVGTNLGVGTNVDANIGQTAPVHPSSFRWFGRGIASCSRPQDASSWYLHRSRSVPRPARHRGGPCAREKKAGREYAPSFVVGRHPAADRGHPARGKQKVGILPAS